MSDQPVEYRGHNENAHTGKIEIGWPPSEEPTWNPERIRAVALELAIKTVNADKIGFSIDKVLGIAEQYRAFVDPEPPS